MFQESREWHPCKKWPAGDFLCSGSGWQEPQGRGPLEAEGINSRTR